MASNRLQQKAQDQTALAAQQDVLLTTDQAYYRLLNAQSLLEGGQGYGASQAGSSNSHRSSGEESIEERP